MVALKLFLNAKCSYPYEVNGSQIGHGKWFLYTNKFLIKLFLIYTWKNLANSRVQRSDGTVKLGNKERFDKELIGIKEPFPMTNLPFTS